MQDPRASTGDDGLPYLSLESVSKSFGNVEVIPSLDLQIRRGEMVAFLGPSGCGKTTTLRMIAGLIRPSSGTIRVAGTDITGLDSHARDMGLVFQSYALFPHMTVARNVAFGLEMRKVPKAEIRRQVALALDRVQLSHLAARKPKELSGGQQQRVALARALVIEPSILLLDEPLSNLDAKLRDEMRSQIRELQQATGITTIFVTHDQIEALSMCDRVVVMREGRVEQFGTPREVYERPANPFVAGFVGRINTIPGHVAADGSVHIDGTAIDAGDVAMDPGPADIMVRPHRMRLGTKDDRPGVNTLRGILKDSVFIGDMLQSHVQIGENEITVEEPTRLDAPHRRIGSQIEISWEPSDTMVFPARDVTAEAMPAAGKAP